MKKIVIFVVIILVLGVLAMKNCIINSKRIEQEKSKEQIATTVDETKNFSTDYKEEKDINENSAENIIIENKTVEQDKIETKKADVTKTAKEKTKQNSNKTNNKEKEQTKITEKNKAETKKETKQENQKDTSYEVNVEQKKQCSGNNHLLDVGNTAIWYKTEEEAEQKVDNELEKWDKKLKDDIKVAKNDEEKERAWNNYLKNCPNGYEIFRCSCGEYALIFSYR